LSELKLARGGDRERLIAIGAEFKFKTGGLGVKQEMDLVEKENKDGPIKDEMERPNRQELIVASGTRDTLDTAEAIEDRKKCCRGR
jgi:hypothetical protein